MKIKLLLVIFLTIASSFSHAKEEDCLYLSNKFMSRFEEKYQQYPASLSYIDYWTKEQKGHFMSDMLSRGFTEDDMLIAINALKKSGPLNIEEVREYMSHVLTLKPKKKLSALEDIEKLSEKERSESAFIKNYLKVKNKIQEKFSMEKISPYFSRDENKYARYKELYYGCRAYYHNEANKIAGRDFKRFNYALSLATLGGSYAIYNMDKEKDADWFIRLGYDLATSILFTFVGGMIHTNPHDSQVTKSLKNYLVGRGLSLIDIVVYEPLFNRERELAVKKIDRLKNDPQYQQKIAELLEYYKKRGVIRQYKDAIVNALRKIPSNLSLDLNADQAIDKENNINWNNLTKKYLDRPVVQEVLVAAAMAEVYQQTKGQLIETSDAGFDRYAFNTFFYALNTPKSIFQNYYTYQILCMGQDNAKASFLKAALFNVSLNFLANLFLFDVRDKAISR